MKKYIYQLPIARVGSHSLIIAHNIFLTEKQRYTLQEKDSQIMVQGNRLAVWLDNYCFFNEATIANYIICNSTITQNLIVKKNEIYNIFLDRSRVEALKNIKDGGAEFVAFMVNDVLQDNKEVYPLIHQIVIK